MASHGHPPPGLAGDQMGLDGVELIMAVEKEFKIAIADADAAQCSTVGALVDLVDVRLRHSSDERCPSQHGFYVVRQELMRLLAVKRSAVGPETPLADLMPRSTRRATWRRLLTSLTKGRTTIPRLRAPKWLKVLVWCVIPSVTAIYISVFRGMPLRFGLWAVLPAAVLANWLSVPLKREFPGDFSRVQDLITFVTTLDSRTWAREDVFLKLRSIIVEQIGVDESDVTLEASFKDLGVN
jgi:acyl carrier protein